MSDVDIQKTMHALQAYYRSQLAARVPELEQLAQGCMTDHWVDNARETLTRHAHQLAGMGTTYGFPHISAAGRALEDALRAQPDARPQTFYPLTIALLDLCRAEMRELPSVAVTRETEEGPVVLVVDDDPIIALTVKRLLKHNARVITAASAEEARMKLAEMPQLILLDHQIEGKVSGLQLLQELRSQAQAK